MTDALAEKRDLPEKRVTPLHGGKSVKEILESAEILFSRMKSEGEERGEIGIAESSLGDGEQFVPATWLDALPSDRYEAPQPDGDRIAAVNSDEAGLYRMFLRVSP